ncbi:Crp/Fnr family transcriptional regulator [Clostridium sp. 'deep sea']|uniref:Crp/Fnr family transcriptional regulator n=1 Tax=Clostridium sp. 'deep sea' TaxID=2779445 RepID=UPI00189693D0|nr:Crp/Fnr family transcriptional regulator [Clostridium sp. 'deep sea']QOR34205.1 Crp/Fnr family transcriptional regulator [Clostridium sp. 'deep sea']
MNLEKYFKLLNNNPLFAVLNEQEQQKLLNVSSRIAIFKKNRIVYMEQKECLSLDLILKGRLVVQDINKNGNVVLIKHINKGETIGANLLFANNNKYPMTFIAKTQTSILQINKNTILDLCHNNSLFLQQFLLLVSEQAIFLATKVKSLNRKSLRRYIVEFLQQEYHNQQSRIIKLPLTKKELAEKFAVQRSSLSRELQKMKKEGLINYDANTITIVNLALNT